MHAVAKYLERHAEPERALADAVDGRYERAIVVPTFCEDPAFVDGLVPAVKASRGRTLAIVVVNARVDASTAAHDENARSLAGLVGRLDGARRVARTPNAWLGAEPDSPLDVLVVDRATAGARLPKKQGVGLARKIGTDVALSLHVTGKVASRFLFGTDADATLPEGHFDLTEVERDSDVAAAVFPFWHDAGSDVHLTDATALYELWLRYYVLGLAWAGSPYAFHTLGSATAVSAAAYAGVRGFPKREAAEDFYLLNKIAKVGKILRARGAPVRLASRASERTPFGTGRRVAETIAVGVRDFYAPEAFSTLRSVVRACDSFAEHADVERFFADVAALAPAPRSVTLAFLNELDARRVLATVSREIETCDARRRRVHSWFDAFRTLKLIHALRDRCFPSVRWHAAIELAPFCAPTASGDPVMSVRARLASAERDLPLYAGPTVPSLTCK